MHLKALLFCQEVSEGREGHSPKTKHSLTSLIFVQLGYYSILALVLFVDESNRARLSLLIA